MWINVVSACISAHCLRAFQQNGSAVEDTKGDLHNGTMTLVTCEDYGLLTTLENLYLLLGRGTMASLSSLSCFAADVSLDQQENCSRSPKITMMDILQPSNIYFSPFKILSADPGLGQGRGGAWDHRRCGTSPSSLSKVKPSKPSKPLKTLKPLKR